MGRAVQRAGNADFLFRARRLLLFKGDCLGGEAGGPHGAVAHHPYGAVILVLQQLPRPGDGGFLRLDHAVDQPAAVILDKYLAGYVAAGRDDRRTRRVLHGRLPPVRVDGALDG